MSIGPEGRKKQPQPVPPRGAEVEVPAMREARRSVMASDGPSQDKLGANGVEKDYVFDLDFIDQRKRKWTGRFKTHALTYREKMQVGLVRAKLSAGVPQNTIDQFTGQLIEILAHLSVALTETPPWATRLEDLHDPAVVVAIYQEVASHEARFHGADSGTSGEANGAEHHGIDGDHVDDEGGAP